jgi:hypothetical protein
MVTTCAKRSDQVISIGGDPGNLCGNCRYAVHTTDLGPDLYSCRAQAPSPGTPGGWPVVKGIHWCARWDSRTPDVNTYVVFWTVDKTNILEFQSLTSAQSAAAALRAQGMKTLLLPFGP